MNAPAHRPARVLLVAYHFPPSDAVGARRPAALARSLLDRGWDVRVLASPAEPGADAAGDCWEGLVIRAVPALRGVFRPRRPAATAPNATPAVGRIFGAADGWARAVAREVLYLPDPQASWIRPAISNFLAGTERWRPDVIVATAPPFSTFLVAASLARRASVPWVADYRDLWTVGNHYWGFGRSPVRRRLDQWLERRLLRGCRLCVTVSEPLAQIVRGTFGVPTEVVLTGVERRRAPSAAARTRAPLTLTHVGSLYEGKRDPRPLLEALNRLGAARSRTRVILAGPDSEVARRAVAATGTADVVTVLGTVPPAEADHLHREADTLVLLMWNDWRDRGTLSGKVFDYLAARRPILMIGYEDGAAARLIRSRNAGVVLNDPRRIADQLRAWCAIKERDGRLPSPPESALDGLGRDEQMARYAAMLDRLVRGG
jgi:hypothetical protein